MFISAGVYRIAIKQGHSRRMMRSPSAKSARMSSTGGKRSPILAQFSNDILRILQQRQQININYNIRPIGVTSSRHFFNSVELPSADPDTSSSNSTSVVRLELDCGTIDGDDDDG